MLAAEGCLTRRRALQDKFPDCDLLVVSQPHHVYYLSGFLPLSSELARWWGMNFLLIDRDGGVRLVVDNWGAAYAETAHVDDRTVWPWYDFSGPADDKYAAAAEALAQVLEKHYSMCSQTACERAHLPVDALAVLDATEVLDLGPELQAMRRVKHEDELVCIRHAMEATAVGHVAARAALRPGVSEMEVYADIQAATARAAGEPILMLGDFAGGKRTEAGGGPPTDNVLRAGDLIILDLFPIIRGYRADFTNTYCVGEPTQAQRDHLAVLQCAMEAVEEVLRPGASSAEIYAACRAPIAKAGLGEAFFHHAGHGLGLGHPEAPFFVPNSTEVLRAGEVVTVEPGAYVEGFGGARIEHDYLITENSFERLSHHEIGL
ncbi:MAG: Xaa-Pro peptidase family protein [Anaerolineales bacterium]|mgnify:CR=1 FL=1|jgi:Xaa-Pro aminopeptidase|nr:Xaa-Pro peptidase family protein [Arenicellales bacterium]MDP7644821.1 Xaa-Pro peptidase family protein [Anaerolineales bacterium]|tara:strand:+ start:1452 stop:2579 length:1128 start_codon:yes stop_codon:yes gene_type:complete